MLSWSALISAVVLWAACVEAVNVIETTSRLTFSNDRLSFEYAPNQVLVIRLIHSLVS